jgi:hypothetical protein
MIRQIASTGRQVEDAVEDQETPRPLDEPEDQPEPESAPGDDEEQEPAAGGGLLSTAALLGFAAVLVVFAMVMSALYLRERGGRADYDRLLAASNAQLNAAQDQLKSAQPLPTLDPKAYEAIRKCVLQGAEYERLQEELDQYFANGRPSGLPTTLVTVMPTGFPIGSTLPGTRDPKVCEDAATYLK